MAASFLDLTPLDDEQRMLRDATHKVAEEVLRPAAQRLDHMPPDERIAPDSPYFEAMGTLRDLGYHRLFLPAGRNGLDEETSPLTQAIVLEELGWGSLGLTTSFLVDLLPFRTVAEFGNPDLQRELLEPWVDDTAGRYHGCWAITEPDHGSDFIGMRDPASRAAGKLALTAERTDDGWLLRGQKSAWVSSAPVATHAAVHAQVAGADDTLHSFYAVVDLDSDGVQRGRPVDMLGVRDDPQGELFFDGVFVPDSRVLIAPGPFYSVFAEQLLCLTSSVIANVSVGIARAAFEEALGYARQRRQGGSAIAEHKNIQLTLYSMFEKVETARSYARLALEHATRTLPGSAGGTGASPRHTRTAQVFTKRVAFEVAHDAVQVCGAIGLSRETLVEKLFRDARCLLVEDGTLEVLGLEVARDLVANYERETYDIETVMARH